MRSLFHDLSIGRRLSLAFGLVSVLLVVVAGSGIYAVDAQIAVRDDQQRLTAMRDDVKELRYLDNDVIGWQGFIYAEATATSPTKAVDPEAANMAGLIEVRPQVERLLSNFDVNALTEAERSTFELIEEQWGAFFAANDAWIEQLGRATSPADMRAAFTVLNDGDLANTWSALLESTESLVASVDERTDALADLSSAKGKGARISIPAAAGVTLLIALLLAVAVTRSIVRPVREVVVAIERVAEGDLTASPQVRQRDEIGRLAEAFDATMSSLRQIVATMASTATTVTTSAEGIAATSTAMSDSASATSSEAQRASATATAVSQNVETVASGSAQMSASIEEIARSSQGAADVVSEAVRGAEATSVTVGRLGTSSQEIGNVVKVITSIAEQTNLLALNATIEAARAGEAGKGFAVVANEVKELAQETAKATEDISRRVDAIQADAAGAVEAIDQIAAIVARINASQITIAAAVEEQTLTTREMNRNVTDAAAGSSEIAGTVSRVADAARLTTDSIDGLNQAVADLSQTSAQLQELVATFRYE